MKPQKTYKTITKSKKYLQNQCRTWQCFTKLLWNLKKSHRVSAEPEQNLHRTSQSLAEPVQNHHRTIQCLVKPLQNLKKTDGTSTEPQKVTKPLQNLTMHHKTIEELVQKPLWNLKKPTEPGQNLTKPSQNFFKNPELAHSLTMPHKSIIELQKISQNQCSTSQNLAEPVWNHHKTIQCLVKPLQNLNNPHGTSAEPHKI